MIAGSGLYLRALERRAQEPYAELSLNKLSCLELPLYSPLIYNFVTINFVRSTNKVYLNLPNQIICKENALCRQV